MSENEICLLRNVKRDTGENSDAAWLDGAAESGSGCWSGKTIKMADEGNTNCHDMGDNLCKLKLSETADEEKDKPLASDNGDFSSFLDVGTKYSNKKLFTDPATVTPPASLSELIAELHQIFAHDDVCVEYVQKLMTSYKSNPADWKRFAKFDKYKYTRNLVDEGNGRFNLMILCWNESQGSSIHSHADSHCFLKVLNGEVKEELYHWPDVTSTSNDGTSNDVIDQEKEAAMRKKGDMKFGRDQCTYINDSLGLHRVENESHFNKAVTLHLYSPPFQECSCFDQRSGRATVAKMTFWSKFGKRTPFGKNPEQAVEDN